MLLLINTSALGKSDQFNAHNNVKTTVLTLQQKSVGDNNFYLSLLNITVYYSILIVCYM